MTLGEFVAASVMLIAILFSHGFTEGQRASDGLRDCDFVPCWCQ